MRDLEQEVDIKIINCQSCCEYKAGICYYRRVHYKHYDENVSPDDLCAFWINENNEGLVSIGMYDYYEEEEDDDDKEV